MEDREIIESEISKQENLNLIMKDIYYTDPVISSVKKTFCDDNKEATTETPLEDIDFGIHIEGYIKPRDHTPNNYIHNVIKSFRALGKMDMERRFYEGGRYDNYKGLKQLVEEVIEFESFPITFERFFNYLAEENSKVSGNFIVVPPEIKEIYKFYLKVNKKPVVEMPGNSRAIAFEDIENCYITDSVCLKEDIYFIDTRGLTLLETTSEWAKDEEGKIIDDSCTMANEIHLLRKGTLKYAPYKVFGLTVGRTVRLHLNGPVEFIVPMSYWHRKPNTEFPILNGWD